MPEDMPDRVPEDMPEHIAEDMPGRMPEDMQDRMPEDMPEDMSERMPEDLPVTKRIDVMVGITRSKEILRRTLRRRSREKRQRHASVFIHLFWHALSAGLAISWSQYDVSIGFGHANQQNSKVQTTSSV
jgi:hypothetical protein